MNIKHDSSSFPCHDQMNIDQLQAALFTLTTQYTIRPCSQLAEKIVDHILFLCHHPYIDLLPVQRAVYARLLNYWRTRILLHRDPSATKLLH